MVADGILGSSLVCGACPIDRALKKTLLPAGYTPLHMAVGYSRIPSVHVLIDAGADLERPDKKGRTVIALVEDLRKAMPLTAELMGRRSMLEQVIGVLTGGHHGAGVGMLPV